MPRFITSFVLSIPFSLGLPYIFFGLTFRFSSCGGGMFCLSMGLELLSGLGFLLFAFPLFLTFILLSSFFNLVDLDKSLEAASFVAQPAWPFSGFTMLVRPTTLLAFLPQLVFWDLVVHLSRIGIRKLRRMPSQRRKKAVSLAINDRSTRSDALLAKYFYVWSEKQSTRCSIYAAGSIPSPVNAITARSGLPPVPSGKKNGPLR
jgi:hypothetical protein